MEQESFIVPITPISRPVETLYGSDVELERFVTNAFISGRVRGTFSGVFVPTCEFAWSVLIFIRFGYIAGDAGVLGSLGLVLLCALTMVLTATSVFALATNGLPQGGMYRILEQSLGKGVGGAITWFYFFGIVSLVGVEIVGSVEGLLLIYPLNYTRSFYYDRVILSLVTLLLCYVLSIAPQRIIKISGSFFIVVLLVSFLSVFTGLITASRLELDSVHGPEVETILGNLLPANEFSLGYTLSFLVPCFIGIYSGVHHADALSSPYESIPSGGSAAILASVILYSTFFVMLASVADRKTLLRDTMLTAHVAYPSKLIAAIGIYSVGVGASFQSILIGKDILKSLRNDFEFLDIASGIISPSIVYAQLTVILAAPLLLATELEYLGEITTMAFLLCYASTNLACFLLSSFQTPFWRPQFQYHGSSLSLAGFLLNLLLMFTIRWYFALLVIMTAIIVAYSIHNFRTGATFGLGLQSLMFHTVLRYLVLVEQQQFRQELDDFIERFGDENKIASFTSKGTVVGINEIWRPRILSFVEFTPHGNIRHPKLISLIAQLSGESNLCIFANVVSNEKDKDRIEYVMKKHHDNVHVPLHANPKYIAIKEIMMERRSIIQKCIQREKLLGFVKIISAPELRVGERILLQSIGMGIFTPNTIVIPWPTLSAERWTRKQWLLELQELWLLASRQNLSLILCKGLCNFPSNEDKMHGDIDVWWIEKEAQLLLLVAYLLTQSKVWKNCRIRLFVMCHCSDDKVAIEEELTLFLKFLRLTVHIITVVPVELTDIRFSDTSHLPVGLKRWREELIKIHEANLMTLNENEIGEVAAELAEDFSAAAFTTKRPSHASSSSKEYPRSSQNRNLMVADIKVLQELKSTIEEHSRDSSLVILNMPVPLESPTMQAKSMFTNYIDLSDYLSQNLRAYLTIELWTPISSNDLLTAMTSVNRNAIILYRSILRLHKKLPPAMRSLGDDYVKSEFKRHKACEAKFIPPFMQEWDGYLNVLKQQVSQKSLDDSDISFGKKLEPEKLERFTTEQVGQLYVLKQEATLLRPKEQDDHKEDEGLKGTDNVKPKK